jgi:hypothetical protein
MYEVRIRLGHCVVMVSKGQIQDKYQRNIFFSSGTQYYSNFESLLITTTEYRPASLYGCASITQQHMDLQSGKLVREVSAYEE